MSAFTRWTELDPDLFLRQVEAALGQSIFTPFSRLDPELAFRQIEQATGQSLSHAARSDPALIMREVDVAVVAGGGGDTAPDWVPADAKIHIDFVGDRAWTEAGGAVAIDTLLGGDPNTENAWDQTGYSASDLTADGFVQSTQPFAFIGLALDKFLSGATVRYALKQLAIPPPITAIDLLLVSADGNDALDVSIAGVSLEAFSWGGNQDAFITDVFDIYSVGAVHVVAATIVGMRLEATANGYATPIAFTLVDADRPAANPLVAALMNLDNANQSIQSITIYDPLPNTTGLSALSEELVEGELAVAA